MSDQNFASLILIGIGIVGVGFLFVREALKPMIEEHRRTRKKVFYKREIDHCRARMAELNEIGDVHTVEYADLGNRLHDALVFFAGPETERRV